jgi:hypothetical protein
VIFAIPLTDGKRFLPQRHPLPANRCRTPHSATFEQQFRLQVGKSRPIVPRLFRNTEQCLRQLMGLNIIS